MISKVQRDENLGQSKIPKKAFPSIEAIEGIYVVWYFEELMRAREYAILKFFVGGTSSTE